MKKIIKSILCIVLALLLLTCIIACDDKTAEAPDTSANTSDNGDADNTSGITATGVWANATYTEAKQFGEGAKTFTFTVKAEGQSLTFTIKTDKSTVGEALLEHALIDGEESQYGLYIKKVNGITADYDVNKAYWAFYINGSYAMSGVDTTKITEGETYSLEYTK